MIWGIDPASKTLAMFGTDGYLTQAHKLVVKKTDRGHELTALRREMEHWLNLDQDPIIYVEEPVLAGARNIRSTILIAETVGMVLSYAAPTYLVPVSSWKADTVGNGNASKPVVSEWLKETHPDYHQLCGSDQDLIDAAAICCYGIKVTDRALGLRR